MAVQSKPERSIPRSASRPAQPQTPTPPRPSVQRPVAQTQSAGHPGTLKTARDAFAHKTTQRPVHAADAKYSAGPRPQSPLRAITKETPSLSSGGLPSHHDAVAFLDSFLARAGKIRSKA